MRITLTVTEGPDVGRTFTFEEHSTFLVGRALEAHFRMPEDDRYFSRLHFLVELNPPLCRLVDMKTQNGTFVNGLRVQQTDLKDGDLIRAGRTALCVSVNSDFFSPSTEHPLPTLVNPAAPSAGGAPPTALPASVAESNAPMAQWLTSASAPVGGDFGTSESLPAIPGYDLLRELGRGGMGVVYQARSRTDGSPAAIKTILPTVKPSELALARFLREVSILRELSHPNIVRFQDSGQAGDRLFFVMDFVEGSDAGRLVAEHGPLPVDRAVGLVCQLLDALIYAHSKGFVHRDIKPGNLLVCRDGSREVAKLLDFGLARTYQASQLSGLTMTGSTGGTPAFMPPEQVLDFRAVKPAADQYSAAAALYSLLTARPLYDGTESPMDLMLKILQAEPTHILSRRRDLPPALAAAIHRALARKPEERFPDVGAFRNMLIPFTARC